MRKKMMTLILTFWIVISVQTSLLSGQSLGNETTTVATPPAPTEEDAHIDADVGPNYDYDDYNYDEDYQDEDYQNETLVEGEGEDVLDLFGTPTLAEKFLLCENLPKLKTLEREQLLEFAADEDFLQTRLPGICTASISVLIEKLPESFVLNITSTPGLLQKFSDEQIVEFSENFQILNRTNEKVLIDLVDSRPRLVSQLPMQVFEEFIRRKSFIKGLQTETMMFLFMSEKLTERLLRLPHDALGKCSK